MATSNLGSVIGPLVRYYEHSVIFDSRQTVSKRLDGFEAATVFSSVRRTGFLELSV